MCTQPVLAINFGLKENGKQDVRILNVHPEDNLNSLRSKWGDMLLTLPCGHCIECCSKYKNDWAVRIMAEVKDHEFCSFLTLTYADEFLPGSLEKRPLQLFLKRLRKQFGNEIRYFACGEVGEGKGIRKGFNPHYHIILFGFDFPDKKFLKRGSNGESLYSSSILEHLWPYGLSSIGSVSFASAKYVAKYSVKKKITGQSSGEFVLMSRRPGIGSNLYRPDMFKNDYLYINGHHSIPRYYKKLAEAEIFNIDFMNFKDRCAFRSKLGLYSWTRSSCREENYLKFNNTIKINAYLNSKKGFHL